MPKLGVNIDHLATLREIRKGKEPIPVFAAAICEKAGADSIVVHLREDRRHIQDNDVLALRKSVKTRLNLEMSAAKDIVDIACRIRPDQATLVPEKRREITTEGGLNVFAGFKKLKPVVAKLKQRAIEVSLFIDPVQRQIEAAGRLGVKKIELHTGRYANAGSKSEADKCLRQLKKVSIYAREIGLEVAAGHGLDYNNVKKIAGIKEIEELNIGYAIVCRAAIMGLEKAVRKMKTLIKAK